VGLFDPSLCGGPLGRPKEYVEGIGGIDPRGTAVAAVEGFPTISPVMGAEKAPPCGGCNEIGQRGVCREGMHIRMN